MAKKFSDKLLSDRSFGESIVALMDEKKVTYRQLATWSGLSAGYLNHIVHGNRPVPDEEVLGRIAEAFGKAPDWFLESRIRKVEGFLLANPKETDRLYSKMVAVELV